MSELAEFEVRTPSNLALMRNEPAKVLEEAALAANALQDVLRKKPKPFVLNGETYLEFEDWQTLGRFYGITAKIDGDPEFVQFGQVEGFKASAVAIQHGEVISRATAYCLSDEEKWGSRPKYIWMYICKDGSLSADDPGRENIVWEPNPNKAGGKRRAKKKELAGDEKVPLFQLASMAQTRACAKCLRNVLSWVVVLAGYKGTPAEELGAGDYGSPVDCHDPEPPAKEPPKPPEPRPEPITSDCMKRITDALTSQNKTWADESLRKWITKNLGKPVGELAACSQEDGAKILKLLLQAIQVKAAQAAAPANVETVAAVENILASMTWTWAPHIPDFNRWAAHVLQRPIGNNEKVSSLTQGDAETIIRAVNALKETGNG